jgi:hypothetical protein
MGTPVQQQEQEEVQLLQDRVSALMIYCIESKQEDSTSSDLQMRDADTTIKLYA